MYMIERVIKKSIKENTYLLGMKYVFNFRLLPNTYGGRAWIYDRESVNAQKDLYNFVKKSKRRKEYPCTFLYIYYSYRFLGPFRNIIKIQKYFIAKTPRLAHTRAT